MARKHATCQALARSLRDVGLALLGAVRAPHEELLALVWGPRFDREHALRLAALQPEQAGRMLPALLSAADDFDTLTAHSQQRLRSLIQRHQRHQRLAHKA